MISSRHPSLSPSSSVRPPHRSPRSLVRLCLLLAAGLGVPFATATRAGAAELPTRAEAKAVNEDTVGIVFHYEDVYRRLIDDMAVKFADTRDLRVVPIIGLNHVQTIYDTLYLENVDLGIVHSDVFEYMVRTGRYPRVRDRIRSLAEISTEKVAVIAGERYGSLEDLAGRKVNFRPAGKGEDVTGTILFDTIGVEVEPTRFDKSEALEKVKSGEIAAMLYLVEEPVEEFTSLSPADGVRLIGLPQSEPLLAHYRKAKLTSAEFPELIKGEGAVLSLDVPVIIAAYHWTGTNPARLAKSRRFATALLDGLEALKRDGDAELWKNASMETEIPGVLPLPLVERIVDEREMRAQRAQAAAARLVELEARQQALSAELAERLENGTVEPAELAEFERLIERMRTVLEAE